MIPVGGSVIPDAIGIKNGIITAIEIENGTVHKDYPRLNFKKSKYENDVILNYINNVEWIIKGTSPKKTQDSWYEIEKSYHSHTYCCFVLEIP